MLMRILNSCSIYFIQHGESLANINSLVGISSSPLSSVGIKQTKILSRNLARIDFAAIYSSEFKRTKETAKIIADERRIKIEIDRRLNEWNIGRLDGNSQYQFDKETSAYFSGNSGLKSDERFRLRLFPEMETPEEIVKRMTLFIKERSSEHLGKNIKLSK